MAVVDTANHPMLSLRCTRQKRRFSVLGCNRAVGRGFVLFTGDDTGVIHRWELSRAFLERLGAHETPRVRRSATVERRMGNPCIQPHVLAGIIAGVRSSRRLSRATPVEGAYFGSDDAEASAASAVMPVWCGCWQAHADGVSILQWMPESETLLSGSADGYARVWTFDGVLLGTLDPNPRNQPAPKLNPDVLTQQLAQKLQKEAEQRALFKESALSVTGSAHPSRPGTASGRPRSPARGSGSLLVEEETQALLRQAAAAVKVCVPSVNLRVVLCIAGPLPSAGVPTAQDAGRAIDDAGRDADRRVACTLRRCREHVPVCVQAGPTATHQGRRVALGVRPGSATSARRKGSTRGTCITARCVAVAVAV